ncbi:MAG: formyl transferase [Crocinitomicaceae bacterium]
MTKKTAIIIATKGITTNLLFETLSEQLDVKSVLIEQKISKSIILKGRIKKVGLSKVLGQLMFVALVLPILKINSNKKISKILTRYHLSNKSVPQQKIKEISSVNDRSIIDIVSKLNPDLIFINGTRIISGSILAKLPVKPINIHVGITPKYRGIHGGYWAKFYGDHHLFGTTLHHVDSGIDSGKIIDQSIIKSTVKDNFITYPILQYCEGLQMIKSNIKTIENPNYKTPLTKESILFFHPTIWQYLQKRFTIGIR